MGISLTSASHCCIFKFLITRVCLQYKEATGDKFLLVMWCLFPQVAPGFKAKIIGKYRTAVVLPLIKKEIKKYCFVDLGKMYHLVLAVSV